MIMQWDVQLATGVTKIDTQHKELFHRINDLLVAMKEGRGKNEISKTLDFLEVYVVKHFDDEEELQKKNNYSGYNVQHEQHEDFKRQLVELKAKFNSGGINSSLAIETQKQMTTWWRTHIIKLDKDLGSFLLAK